MTNEEAIKLLSQIRDVLLKSNSWLPSTHNPIKESFGMAINALTAQESNKLATNLQPCKQDDLVSRQTAIDALMAILDKPNHAEFLYTDEICKALGELPSAEPTQSNANSTQTNAEPEIVRCKACQYATRKYYTDGNYYCTRTSSYPWSADGFCSDGVRREDE